MKNFYYRVPGIANLVRIPAAHREIADMHISLIYEGAVFRYGSV